MARYVRFETVKRLLMAKRDSIPLTVVERYSFGCPTPNEHGMSMRGGVNAAIKCLEEALRNGDSVDIVRCEKCRFHQYEVSGMVYCPHIIGGWVSEDFFCAFGRKGVNSNDQ